MEMEKYTKNMKTGEYLFKSRKGENRAITTVQAYRIISEATKRIGLEEIIHSLYCENRGGAMETLLIQLI